MTLPRIAPWILITLGCVALAGCSSSRERASRTNAAVDPAVDIHSYGNPDEVRPHHLSLDLELDFATNIITGETTIEFRREAPTRRMVLDTRDLEINAVHGLDASGGERELDFKLRKPDPKLGAALEIALPEDITSIRVHYRTSPGAIAVQWLEPQLTAGGEHPFLFTQSQSIHARSWIPCMDSPGVRVTYDATVHVPTELQAVMSAEPAAADEPGVFRFEMPQSIPPYLIALAVGELDSRDISPRVRIYAEPSVVDKAAWEFADTETMIQTVEEMYGPYVWGRYDLLVLPPSFPFGGMENPRLSFLTPTVLAGDRTLVSLIAHELAHSWSGNLVTNATWRDFWINEGFTVYVERRVVEALFGREIAEMEATLGLRDLREDIAEFGPEHEFTKLAPDLAGYDPDDAFSNVPYEKGYLLLRLIEEHVGRDAFDRFLKELFERHAFGNLTTAQIADEMRARLFTPDPGLEEKIRLDEWLYAPGLPENCPEPHSDEFEAVSDAVWRFSSGADPATLDTENWRTTHWLQFIRALPQTMGTERMQDLDQAYGFTISGNSEIFFAWSRHAARNNYEPALPTIELFLKKVGRKKFLTPLYGDLVENPETADFARRVYREARSGYHPIAQREIERVVGFGSSDGEAAPR